MREGNEYEDIEIHAQSVHLGNTYGPSGHHTEPTVETFIEDLFLTDASDDLAKTLRLKGKRVKGTCEWVLGTDEFTDWENENDWKLLWLIGAPGIGKTVIFCFLVGELEQKVQESASTILIHYLCDNKDDQRSTATAILRGILVQLLKQRPALFEHIKHDYKLKKTTIIGNLDALWRAFLVMLKKCIDKVYILIDALDECEESSRRELLNMLGDLVGLPNARILITARPESDIQETARTLGQTLRLDSAKINDDLSEFINIRVDELKQKKKDFPARLIEDIRAALKDKAGGTFLWASLLLKDISLSQTTRAARKKVVDLPSDLPSVYKRILDNIKDDNLDDAVLILQWVVVSRRPMTVIELATAHALAANAWHDDCVPTAEFLEDFMDGYKACGPLLYRDDKTKTINLVHQSAKEYLERTDCLPSEYRVNRDTTNLTILNTCWTYLSMREFQHGSVIIACSEENELQPRQLTNRIRHAYGFLGYSTEELRDAELAERLDLLYDFIGQHEDLDVLPPLRDFWFIALVRGKHVKGAKILIEKGANPSVSVCVQGQSRWTALHVAAEAGNNDIVRLLLDQGVDVKSRTGDGEMALHLAAKNGFSHICSDLIDHGTDPDAKNQKYHQTALHLAVQEGHRNVVTILLQKGANIDEKEKYGITALMKAASQHREDLALFLLEKGANPKIIDSDGETALGIAASRGHYEIVKVLLEKKVGFIKNRFGETALSQAVTYGHVATAKLLMDGGADLGWRNKPNRESLLHVAAGEGHKDMVKLLVEKGLDVNALVECLAADHDICADYNTALHIASEKGDSVVVEVLIEAGADVNIKGGKGLTALHLAAYNGHDSVVAILLKAGADIDAPNYHGWTALHHAADNGRRETVLLLLENGANINVRAKGEETVLHIMAGTAKVFSQWGNGKRLSLRKQDQDAQMVRLLLKQGADVKAVNLNGLTPLHLAARAGNQVITDLLRQSDADIDATDESGLTALHCAASKKDRTPFWPDQKQGHEGHEGVAVMLLEKGASVGMKDKAGRTPLFAAAVGEHACMCCILLAKGADGATMRTVVPGGKTYPKMDELRRATLQVSWHNITERTPVSSQWISRYYREYNEDEEDGEDGEDKKDQQNQRLAGKVLWLLFEMAAFTILEANTSPSKFIDACGKGHDSVVSTLLAKDVDASIPKKDKETALERAAMAGHEAIVRLLVESGVNADPESSDRQSALQLAAECGHENIVRFLLEKGAKVGRMAWNFTPLLCAASGGHAKVVEILLDHGADLSEHNSCGCDPYREPPGGTALHWSAWKGHGEVVRVALERGAAINERKWFLRSTPLIEAVRGGREAVVRQLLAAGADVTLKDKDGNTALSHALTTNRRQGDGKIVLLLLQYGADPRTKGWEHGRTLLSWAMDQGGEVMVDLLKRECFAIKGRDGQVLLTWAMEKGHEDVVRRLLEMGVQTDVQASDMLLAHQPTIYEISSFPGL